MKKSKKEQVYNYLIRYCRVEIDGRLVFNKTDEQMAKALKTSVQNIRYHLKSLKKDGIIKTERKVLRLIKILRDINGFTPKAKQELLDASKECRMSKKSFDNADDLLKDALK